MTSNTKENRPLIAPTSTIRELSLEEIDFVTGAIGEQYGRIGEQYGYIGEQYGRTTRG